MNARPDSLNFAQFGAQPQAATGIARVLPAFRTFLAGGALASVALLVAQRELPESWKPSVILGAAAGAGEKAEIIEKADTSIAYERAKADGVSQATTKAQADLAAIQAALQQRTESLQVQTTIGGVADLLCLGGKFVTGLGSYNTGSDIHNGAATVADATCGLGDVMRDNVTRSQLDAVRTAAAARGAPMNDGAVPAPLAPVDTTPHSLDQAYAISRPTRQYGQADFDAALAVYLKLAPSVQGHLIDGLKEGAPGAQIFVERMRAYQQVASAQ